LRRIAANGDLALHHDARRVAWAMHAFSAMTPTPQPYVILAAVDFSAASDLALERAIELATEKPAVALHVVNVLPVYQLGPAVAADQTAGTFAGTLPSTTDAAENLRLYVERRLAAFREAHPQANLGFLDRVVAHQRLDVPSEEIASLAMELEADLVVVGTHGRRGLSRLLLGSVAEGIVRLAPCPVLVVRPKAAPPMEPAIEPACPRCLEARRQSGGTELWCEQHRERHGQRHVYHQGDRGSQETNMPLVVR
jgi:nucleotide-binding universal stress UspA family protein